MKSWLVMMAVALISVTAATVGAYQDKAPDTSAIMKALFKKGAGSKSSVLKTQTEAASPDWPAIQKTTKEIAVLGSELGKGEPEKGDKESWKKLTGKFAKDTAALDESASAKDLASLKAAQKAIGGSCKSCHSAHRGQ